MRALCRGVLLHRSRRGVERVLEGLSRVPVFLCKLSSLGKSCGKSAPYHSDVEHRSPKPYTLKPYTLNPKPITPKP